MPAQKNSPTTSEASAETAQQALNAKQAALDTEACKGFKLDMEKYMATAPTGSPAEAFITAYTALAFDTGERASDAGNGSDVQIALYELSSAAAMSSDEIANTRGLSTKQELASRIAIDTAGDACGIKYTVLE
ncbi:hypothetical protein [Cryobacterium sp. M91]|uniref:hypothetical protein n=1 Tax=Cryobacterium sp. M91 TaxID=2048294 RepID=UPI000CE2D71F|nr:hypothetical protein [Cryobacterium sp. M91]